MKIIKMKEESWKSEEKNCGNCIRAEKKTNAVP
jgi:hypothetical protein